MKKGNQGNNVIIYNLKWMIIMKEINKLIVIFNFYFQYPNKIINFQISE